MCEILLVKSSQCSYLRISVAEIMTAVGPKFTFLPFRSIFSNHHDAMMEIHFLRLLFVLLRSKQSYSGVKLGYHNPSSLSGIFHSYVMLCHTSFRAIPYEIISTKAAVDSSQHSSVRRQRLQLRSSTLFGTPYSERVLSFSKFTPNVS